MLAKREPKGLLSPGGARALALLIPAGLLGGALYSQFVGGLYPCEMCIWQRWPHAAAIGFALLAFIVPKARTPLVILAALAIAASGAIGVFHAGVEQGWWEGITGCSTAVGSGTTNPDDLLAEIMAAPIVRCDQIPWSFMGLSLAAWNATISLIGALLILIGVKKGSR